MKETFVYISTLIKYMCALICKELEIRVLCEKILWYVRIQLFI